MVNSTLCVVLAIAVGVCLAAPSSDDACNSIGGRCQDVLTECTGSVTYYSGLCAEPSNRYCCARKIEDSRCKSMGGQCDYNCEGAKPHPGLCEGQLSCCIAFN